jgi:hypothetical protein
MRVEHLFGTVWIAFRSLKPYRIQSCRLATRNFVWKKLCRYIHISSPYYFIIHGLLLLAVGTAKSYYPKSVTANKLLSLIKFKKN